MTKALEAADLEKAEDYANMLCDVGPGEFVRPSLADLHHRTRHAYLAGLRDGRNEPKEVFPPKP